MTVVNLIFGNCFHAKKMITQKRKYVDTTLLTFNRKTMVLFLFAKSMQFCSIVLINWFMPCIAHFIVVISAY